jgi:hypothetical protein
MTSVQRRSADRAAEAVTKTGPRRPARQGRAAIQGPFRPGTVDFLFALPRGSAFAGISRVFAMTGHLPAQFALK